MHAAVVIGCLVDVVECVRVYSKDFVSHRIFYGIHFVTYCKENNHRRSLLQDKFCWWNVCFVDFAEHMFCGCVFCMKSMH